jgi:O-antigen/teichoic acid export membrane protein
VSGLLALGLFPQRVSDAERGLFVAATSLARMPSVFVFGATGTLTPSIVRAGKAGAVGAAGRLLGDATGLVLLVLVPLTAFLTVEARAVLGLILTADFADAAPLLVVLALGLGLLFNLAQLQGAALVAVDRHGLAAVTALLAAALAFAGALLLVPPLGAIGAALAMAGASALLLASNALAAAGALGAWIAPRLLFGHATLGAAAALLAWLVPTRGAWLILEAALLGGCYLAAAAALGLIPAAARAALRARWSAP